MTRASSRWVPRVLRAVLCCAVLGMLLPPVGPTFVTCTARSPCKVLQHRNLTFAASPLHLLTLSLPVPAHALLQFYYGEDGIDPMQTGCLKTFPFLFYNSPQVRQPGGRRLNCVRVCAGLLVLCALEVLWQRASPASHAGPPVSPALSAPSPPCTQFSVQLEAAKALNAPRVDEQAAEEKRARDLVRCGLCCPNLCCLLSAATALLLLCV